MLCVSAAYANMRCLFVCPSVRLSRSYILSKRIKVSSKFFHHRVATPFYFLRTKRHGNIPTGTHSPSKGSSNAGGYAEFAIMSLYLVWRPAVKAATGYRQKATGQRPPDKMPQTKGHKTEGHWDKRPQNATSRCYWVVNSRCARTTTSGFTRSPAGAGIANRPLVFLGFF